MDRAIDSTATKQGCVCRVHDRIRCKFRDVAMDELDARSHF
jgi:hypothetical protein